MAKEDVPPLPGLVPKKRKQIKALLDVHIAMFLAKDDLLPSERRRLEEEKAERRRNNPHIEVGFFGSRAGLSPQQREAIEGFLLNEAHNSDGKLTVHYIGSLQGAAQNFHRVCKRLHHQSQYPVMMDLHTYPDVPTSMQEIMKASTVAIIAVNSPIFENIEPAVIEAFRYARHRELPMKLLWPDGNFHQLETLEQERR